MSALRDGPYPLLSGGLHPYGVVYREGLHDVGPPCIPSYGLPPPRRLRAKQVGERFLPKSRRTEATTVLPRLFPPLCVDFIQHKTKPKGPSPRTVQYRFVSPRLPASVGGMTTVRRMSQQSPHNHLYYMPELRVSGEQSKVKSTGPSPLKARKHRVRRTKLPKV